MSETLPALAHYDSACKALAQAVAVDEVKNIRDIAIAMRVYARQMNNREVEADAVELRMRATRQLGKLIEAQKKTVGLNTGTAGKGRPPKAGFGKNPRKDMRPTLASQGIGKNLAQQARVLSAMDDAAYERKVADARGSVSRVFRRAVREAEIEQERAERRAQTAQGGSIEDLYALIASGFRAGVITIDPPWPFKPYIERARGGVWEHYETMSLDKIKALPVRQLAAKNCALFLWCNWPNMPIWHEVIEAWGFEYSTIGFVWVKTTKDAKKVTLDGEGLHWGNGYDTRSNSEPCLLAKIGKPLRLDEGVHSVIIAPVGEHSEKPDEVYRRIERLYPGPYLELFARQEREGWKTWGDQLPAQREAA